MSTFLRVLAVLLVVTFCGAALPVVVDAVTGDPVEPDPAAQRPAYDAPPARRPAPTLTARPRVSSTPTATPAPRRTPSPAASAPSAPSAPSARSSDAGLPLAGVTVALDPGHQLGNRHFPSQVDAPVPAGGFDKPCNTTGTATDAGVPEATVTFELATAVRRRLVALGARVPMTRKTNSDALWGPCVDARGEFGQRVGARLMLSLHADGGPASGSGFHVIAPQARSPWTTDVAAPSLRLATTLRAALVAASFPRADYVAGGTGLDVRSDLGTLNLSDVPVAMVEIGNMRNRGDAARMISVTGQAAYADALVRGVRSYLRR